MDGKGKVLTKRHNVSKAEEEGRGNRGRTD